MSKSDEKTGRTKVIRWEEQKTQLTLSKCKLTVLSGEAKGKEFVLMHSVIQVGTKNDNHIVLKDETMSRLHFEIHKTKDGYCLKDMGSLNGTFINGVRVKEGFLNSGSTLRAGKTELKFLPMDETFEIVPSKKDRFENMIGGNTAMRKIYTVIEKIAPADVTVIIEGESGTGKELVASALHARSKRNKKPFIVFDCSSVAENLIESELFGHEKGSFTGAIGMRQGAFELANGGTIFLDEIGELNLELQPKLLRVLESRMVRRVGGDKLIPVDVRVIAATNRNLEGEVKKGNFREDLFYRLNVVPIYLPPLRKRKDDIAMLVEYFIEEYNNTNPEQPVSGIDENALQAFKNYDWPGNVRELKNMMSRVISLLETDRITLQQIPDRIRIPMTKAKLEIGDELGFKDAKEQWVASFEKQYVEALIRRHENNISAAAKEAGIDRKSVQRLLRKYDIQVEGLEEGEE